MTSGERDFLEKYYKACNSSMPEDWLDASLAAKRMYNEGRVKSDDEAEQEIMVKAGQKIHGVAK